MNKNTLITPTKTYWYITMLATLEKTIDLLQQQTPYKPKPKTVEEEGSTARRQFGIK